MGGSVVSKGNHDTGQKWAEAELRERLAYCGPYYVECPFCPEFSPVFLDYHFVYTNQNPITAVLAS